MSFIESPRFPLTPSYGVQGGPEYSVTVISVASGLEYRTANWSQARRLYTVTIGPRAAADIEMLLTFFEAVGGKANGFRFKDYSDFKSCAPSATPAFGDQIIGVGDGVTTAFQLTKTRTAGALSSIRPITKPVSGTVLIGVDGSQVSSGWSVDTTTGIVTFGTAPAAGKNVTAGYQFDVPVRFDVDQLPITIMDLEIATVSVNLIELRI